MIGLRDTFTYSERVAMTDKKLFNEDMYAVEKFGTKTIKNFKMFFIFMSFFYFVCECDKAKEKLHRKSDFP